MTAPNDAEDTPVRRSILRNLSNTGYTNDDEAERAHRRRTFGKTPTTLSNDSLIEEQQGLQNCLKIFQDNKICSRNAWSLTLIDNLANLLGSHHKTLKNFQIVGTSLEATTKIYGLRVDSVHSDIVRMSSGLGRMKNNVPSADNDHHNDNDDADRGNETITDENGQPKAPAAKKKRTRKAVSTVTTNKNTLNARLDIIQMPDCLLFQLNSIMGETSSSNKLLLNLLQTKYSDLKLTMDDKFWDSKPSEPITFSADDNYETNDTEYMELPIKLRTDRHLTLRQQMCGYTISNTPMDDEENEEQPPQMNQTSFNMSQCLEYAFDMDAEVEPMPSNDHHYTMDVMDNDFGNDFDDLTQEDRAAISLCKGLRRKTTVIEDLRPSDTTKLEYSYRPLDNINQFWAGPSYWKFRKSRKLTINRESIATSEGSSVAPVAHVNRRKANRLKIEPIKFTTLIESGSENDQDSDDDLFIPADSRQAQKFKKNSVYKRWDSKKLKLPTDLHIDRDLFNYYTFCPSFPIGKKPIETPVISELDADDGYGFDHHADDDDDDGVERPDFNDSVVHSNDMSMELPPMELPNMDEIPESQTDPSLHEISLNYEGAPELVQKIDIQFARRAKVIDMKQMKTVCLNTITKQCEKTASRTFSNIGNMRTDENYKDGAASFGIIYNSLPHLLTKTMAENLSPSIAFYSILHLANEHKLRLYKTTKDNDMNIFLIRQLQEDV